MINDTSPLGIQINTQSAEMYSNSICKKKSKKNTFQQEHGNVCVAPPHFLPSEEATPLGERDSDLVGHSGGSNGHPPKPIQNNNGSVRHLSANDIYTDVLVQVTNFRTGTRSNRATVYINLIPDDSNKIEIKLVADITNSTDETRRSAIKTNNNHLIGIIDQYRQKIPGVMLGRCRYKRVKNSYSSEFKSNIKSALIAIWENDGVLTGEFYCLGEFFPLQLGELTDAQEKFYIAQLEFHSDPDEID